VTQRSAQTAARTEWPGRRDLPEFLAFLPDLVQLRELAGVWTA
jgi:hypothetical protein